MSQLCVGGCYPHSEQRPGMLLTPHKAPDGLQNKESSKFGAAKGETLVCGFRPVWCESATPGRLRSQAAFRQAFHRIGQDTLGESGNASQFAWGPFSSQCSPVRVEHMVQGAHSRGAHPFSRRRGHPRRDRASARAQADTALHSGCRQNAAPGGE